MRGLVTHKLPDPSWGFPQIARVVANEESPWGTLIFLVGTDWEPLFPRIPALILDQALRGYATPMMKILGPPPRALVKRLPKAETLCQQRRSCVNYKPSCVPGPKVPDCWEPGGFHGDQANMVANVVHLWREDILVVVVIPEENPG
jgi:hypothetical protein